MSFLFSNIHVLISATLLIALSTFGPAKPQPRVLSTKNVKKLIKISKSSGLKPQALKAGLDAYAWARSHHDIGKNKYTLTIVDFTLPSYQKRMWVINLKSDKVLMKLHTAQGKNSGLVYARKFSNVDGSDESSLGLYVTSNEYYGHHGLSMRLDGLEKGINNNALTRDIVIHSAWYVTPKFIKQNHRAGRSWGCFAVAPTVKNKLLNTVKGGSVLYAYAKQENHDPMVTDGQIQLT